MTRQHAEREAKKRWGKRAIARAYDEVSSPEKRDTAATERAALKARRDAIDQDVQQRLNALEWYQALTTERKGVVKRLQEINFRPCYYKFSVGESNGLGFHVYGQGDTWEEAFKVADDYKAREQARYAQAAG